MRSRHDGCVACATQRNREKSMKRTAAVIATVAILGPALAHAESEAYDCVPGCETPAAPQARIDLCEYAPVREAARLNERLKPAKEIYDIATNPTGFAVRMVDEHVVHIPKWVGIALDPRGAARGYVIGYVRDAAKRQVGLQRDCALSGVIDESDGLALPVSHAGASDA